MVLKIWSKQLLYIKPDPTPYLLASRTPTIVRLSAAAGIPFLYTNTSNPGVVLADTLSNKEIGYGVFNISFTFTPDKTADYRVLFEIPGLCKFAYNWNAGQGLLFYVENLGWRAISTAYISQEEVEVKLHRYSDASDIVLEVGTYTFTLLQTWVPWSQPVITSATSYGEITDDGIGGTAISMLNKADRPLTVAEANDSHADFHNYGVNYSWMLWRLPVKLRLQSVTTMSQAFWGDRNITTPVTPGLHIYADSGKNTSLYMLDQWEDWGKPLTQLFDESDPSTFYLQLRNSIRSDVITDTLYMVAEDVSGGYNISLNISWLHIEADQFNGILYTTKQLTLYDTKSFNSLIALNTYGG